MSNLSWQRLQQRLPIELQLQIAEDIVFNTRALFIFDVDIDLPYAPENGPPLTMPRLRFWPVVNPPTSDPDHASWPGTYESQISKLIRKLLDPRLDVSPTLRKKLERLRGIITVPNGTVYFNPEKHVICIRDVNYITTRLPPWTRPNFDINHLAFMPGSRAPSVGGYTLPRLAVNKPRAYNMYGSHAEFGIIRSTFPGVQNLYGVHREHPRDDPSKPIEIICPATDPHNLSRGLLSEANRYLVSLRQALYLHHEGVNFIAHLPTLPFKRLVLI